jgi:hypothetical protein
MGLLDLLVDENTQSKDYDQVLNFISVSVHELDSIILGIIRKSEDEQIDLIPKLGT